MKERIHTLQQKGISLLEVLIALVILSVGLLGLAQLQITGIKQNHDAWLRSQATNLTYDMLDRLRVNRNAARGGNYNQTFANIACDRNIVLSGNVTQRDLAEWNNMIACSLPDGSGQITHHGDNQFTVEIRWNEDRVNDESDTESDTNSHQLFSIRTEI